LNGIVKAGSEKGDPTKTLYLSMEYVKKTNILFYAPFKLMESSRNAIDEWISLSLMYKDVYKSLKDTLMDLLKFLNYWKNDNQQSVPQFQSFITQSACMVFHNSVKKVHHKLLNNTFWMNRNLYMTALFPTKPNAECLWTLSLPNTTITVSDLPICVADAIYNNDLTFYVFMMYADMKFKCNNQWIYWLKLLQLNMVAVQWVSFVLNRISQMEHILQVHEENT
jgi:hypothetical protein